ncbi:MAG: alpha/beta hydrolase [Candidatus Buchananbacteria bacterium]
MNAKKHIVIFSHGFGVRKDSGGFFTEIEKMLSHEGIKSVMFDYNKINEEKNELTVMSFSEQAEILKSAIKEAQARDRDAAIDIIAHSQGAVMVALADVGKIRKIVLLAPFFHTDIHDVAERYKKFPSSQIDFKGISRRTRSDGSTTIIPKSYWQERFATDVYSLYNNLASNSDLTIINASEDEIMDKINLSRIFNAHILNVHGDHNFSGENRKNLIEVIKNLVI